jgi:transcription elongation GreA/GreB family factor
MLNTEDKKLVAGEVAQILEEKIMTIHHELQALSSSLQNDTKSSAGDKHETSRAMNQLEQEKLQHQLAELLRQKEILLQTDTNIPHSVITAGSLFQTNKGNFYISIPLGRIQFSNNELIVISPLSPLGKAFLGRKIGDEVEYSNTVYTIIEIV